MKMKKRVIHERAQASLPWGEQKPNFLFLGDRFKLKIMPCDILKHGPCFCSKLCIFPDSTNDTYPLEATNYSVFVVCCPAVEWNCWPMASASEHVIGVSQVNQCAVEWRKNKKTRMCCNRCTACFLQQMWLQIFNGIHTMFLIIN